MQITSTNAGFVSNPGLPTARKQAANTHADAASTANAHTLQRTAPPVVPANTPTNTSTNAANNAGAPRMLVLARQREGVDGLSGNVQTGRLGSEAAAQRAVAEYNSVAMHEQRLELSSVLVGVDVFA
ncbi:MAG TPA: hypothetical protein ENK04_10225 [Gammaproteobacteria bacterium]|nr:hypothetical protein [Gammaproteobacteria bacterium]